MRELRIVAGLLIRAAGITLSELGDWIAGRADEPEQEEPSIVIPVHIRDHSDLGELAERVRLELRGGGDRLG